MTICKIWHLKKVLSIQVNGLMNRTDSFQKKKHNRAWFLNISFWYLFSWNSTWLPLSGISVSWKEEIRKGFRRRGTNWKVRDKAILHPGGWRKLTGDTSLRCWQPGWVICTLTVGTWHVVGWGTHRVYSCVAWWRMPLLGFSKTWARLETLCQMPGYKD